MFRCTAADQLSKRSLVIERCTVSLEFAVLVQRRQPDPAWELQQNASARVDMMSNGIATDHSWQCARVTTYSALSRTQSQTKLEVRGQDIWKKNTYVYRGEDPVIDASEARQYGDCLHPVC